LDKPWLVRYQFYLFDLMEKGKSCKPAKLGCKPNIKPEASSLSAEREGL
jgi:hypothetical protein